MTLALPPNSLPVVHHPDFGRHSGMVWLAGTTVWRQARPVLPLKNLRSGCECHQGLCKIGGLKALVHGILNSGSVLFFTHIDRRTMGKQLSKGKYCPMEMRPAVLPAGRSI